MSAGSLSPDKIAWINCDSKTKASLVSEGVTIRAWTLYMIKALT